MKNKIITILFLILLSSPIYAENQAIDDTLSTNQQEIPYKEPISKRKLAKKFLYAMGGVVVSSMALYIGLSIYNRVREGVIKTHSSDYTNTLNTPSNLKDSINIYLEKTKD